MSASVDVDETPPVVGDGGDTRRIAYTSSALPRMHSHALVFGHNQTLSISHYG